jgi:hypothetical protein
MASPKLAQTVMLASSSSRGQKTTRNAITARTSRSLYINMFKEGVFMPCCDLAAILLRVAVQNVCIENT